jgi:hypothetical protein
VSRLLATSVVVLLAFTRSAAAAEGDPALAEQLYELGRKLMAAGQISEACARFAESQRIDPATGTLLNLATCHEAEGKFATAWTEFKNAEVAARRDGRADRQQYARDHLDAIEPRLSYLTVTVPPASRAPDLEVKLDGTVIGPAAWDVAAPVDPGEHEVTATAAGRTRFLAHVTVTFTARRQAVTIELPAPVAVRPPVVVAPAPPPAPSPEAGDPARVAGGVVAGVSVVALGVGVAFALRAHQKWDARNANDRCDLTDACSPEGVAYGNQAATAATVADVSFAVGVVAAGTAGYLLFLRPRASTATAGVRVAPTWGGVALSGAW